MEPVRVLMGTGWSSRIQSATYSIPAAASRSIVSCVSARPGLSQPRGGLPVKSRIAWIVCSITSAWSSTLCMGFCTKPCPMNSQPASSAALQTCGYSLQTEPLSANVARSLRLLSTSRKRQNPTRIPYSCQHQLGMSGKRVWPMGGVSTVRGMAVSGSQFSTLTIVQTATRALFGSSNGGRSTIGA